MKKKLKKCWQVLCTIYNSIQVDAEVASAKQPTNKVNMNIAKNMNIWVASVTMLIVVLSITQNANAALKKVCVTDNGTKVACITLKKGGK